MVVELPPRVPARLLFQSGPNGESPPIDEIENVSGVTIIQSGSSAVKYSGTPVIDPKPFIAEWARSNMVEAIIIFPGCSKNLREKIRFECHHFWRNRSWICTAEFDDSLSLVPPRLTIEGKRVAVDEIVDLVKKIAGNEISPEINPLVFSDSKSTSSSKDVHIVGPEYRHRSSTHVPPVSILDVLGARQDEVNLKIFKDTFSIETKVREIPKPVVDRLLSAVGPGAWFHISPSGLVDIRVSSAATDLANMRGAVFAFATRAVEESGSLEWITRLSGSKAKNARETEVKWNVLIVRQTEAGECLIIGKDPVSRLLAKIDLGGITDSLIETLPDSLFDTVQDSFDCEFRKRVGRASGTVVDQLDAKTYIFGNVENRDFAKNLLSKVTPPSTISFPVPPLWIDTCLRTITRTEEEYGVMITSSLSQVTVCGFNLIDRVKASVKVLNEVHNFFQDQRDPKRKVPEMYAKTDMLNDDNILITADDGSDDLSVLATALDMELLRLPKVQQVVLVAQSPQTIFCAQLLLSKKIEKVVDTFPEFTLRVSPVDRAKISIDAMEQIASNLGCLLFNDIAISASRFRLALFSHVVGSPDPERQLALVLSGWSQ